MDKAVQVGMSISVSFSGDDRPFKMFKLCAKSTFNKVGRDIALRVGKKKVPALQSEASMGRGRRSSRARHATSASEAKRRKQKSKNFYFFFFK